jgi:sugar lactone lactonase YvrE
VAGTVLPHDKGDKIMRHRSLLLVTVLGLLFPCCKDKKSSPPATEEEVEDPATDTPVAPAPAPDSKAPIMVEAEFMTPESVLYDEASDVYLVSNINGSPFEADDNGFISKVSPDGSVVALKWIDGADEKITLNAPKGLAIAGGTLFVADITTVRMFDLATGAAKGEVAIEGASFLNDLASGSDGEVYVSDTGVKEGFKPAGSDAIYKIVDGKAERLGGDKSFGNPNGLLFDEGLWVVTFGSGELYRLHDGARADVLELPKGQLDGIVKTNDGKILVSSWEASAIFKGTREGGFEIAIADVEAPADIGYDSKRNRVLIPLFNANKVEIVPL